MNKKPYLIKKVKDPQKGLESEYRVYLSKKHAAFIFNHSDVQIYGSAEFKSIVYIVDIEWMSILNVRLYREAVDEKKRQIDKGIRTREIDIIMEEAVKYLKEQKPNGLHHAKIEQTKNITKAKIRVNQSDKTRWQSEAKTYFSNNRKRAVSKTSS